MATLVTDENNLACFGTALEVGNAGVQTVTNNRSLAFQFT